MAQTASIDRLAPAGAFAYAKLPTTDHHAIAALEASGFHLVDTNVVFEKQLAGCEAALSVCEIRSALPEDEQAVVALARNGFGFSRFHLDPQVQNEVANRIKAQWLSQTEQSTIFNLIAAIFAEQYISTDRQIRQRRMRRRNDLQGNFYK